MKETKAATMEQVKNQINFTIEAQIFDPVDIILIQKYVLGLAERERAIRAQRSKWELDHAKECMELSRQRMEEERNRAGIMKKDLKKVFDISAKSYNHCLQNSGDWRCDVLRNMQTVYGCSIDYLLGRTKDREGKEFYAA